MTHSSNLRALAAAEQYGLSYTGGTDGHMLEEVGNVIAYLPNHYMGHKYYDDFDYVTFLNR